MKYVFIGFIVLSLPMFTDWLVDTRFKAERETDRPMSQAEAMVYLYGEQQ